MYLPLPSPHTPILPTKEWQGKSGLNPYGDFVMMVDDYIGKLEKTIKEAGIEDNTIIIVSSDNGCSPRALVEDLEEKGHYPSAEYRGYKSDIFEGGHRVPFIVKWPKAIKPGSVCNQTVCFTDFMATCASIAGVPLKDNEAEDSYSLIALFENPNSEEVYQRKATVHHSIDGSFSLRKGDWKFVFCPTSGGWGYPSKNQAKKLELLPFQLYNLSEDPAETKNLYGKYLEVEKELISEMKAIILNGRSTEGLPQENDGGNSWDQLEWMKTL